MREFGVSWREEEGVEVLQIHGAIDSRTAGIFGAVIESMARSGQADLRVDCHDITFMSSASVGQLVMLVNERRAHGRRVTLERLPDHLLELIKRMRLETFLGDSSKEFRKR